MNVSKTSLVRYECIEDVSGTVMDVSKMSFALWMSQRRLLYVMKFLKDVLLCTLLYFMHISKTSFVFCECFKDVFSTL